MKKKNVLFIAVDDLRPEINCFGKKKLHTPNIDKLADNGLIFTNAYCQYPQCMPSRASVMSGRRPPNKFCGRVSEMLADGAPSLSEYFKQNGYESVSVGKITHFNDDDENGWSHRYSDTFYEQDYASHGYCSGYQKEENKQKIRNFALQFESEIDKKMMLPDICECVEAPDKNYPDAKIAEQTKNEIRKFKESGKPFFLAAGFYRPHLPWAVPKKYWDLYRRGEVDLADNPFFPEDAIGLSYLCDFLHYGDEEITDKYSDIGQYNGDNFPTLSEAKQRECVHGYWASVSFMDAQVGKVLQELEDSGLADSTIVMLWGDNGWHLGEHNLWSKVTSFEESTRVPLLISAPGISKNCISDALVELVDMYPTLCEYCGLELPGHLEGHSMIPLLKNPERPWKSAVFSSIGDFAETIRTRQYRLTRYKDIGSNGDGNQLPNEGNIELFDLDKDPSENVNVANKIESKEIVDEMIMKLSSGWTSVEV